MAVHKGVIPSISFQKKLSVPFRNFRQLIMEKSRCEFHTGCFSSKPNVLNNEETCNIRFKQQTPILITRKYAASLGLNGTKMHAWEITRYGDLGELQLREKDIPKIGNPDEVLIKVCAASVNPIDVKMLRGYGAMVMNRARRISKPGGEFPLTLGRDFSGIVVDSGSAARDFKSGDEVWGALEAFRPGVHAEYVVAKTREITHKPSNLRHSEAASIPYVAITTWCAACTVGKLKPKDTKGKRALVIGGSGGIGTFAIQFLKAWGASVTTTCSPDAFDLVKNLGANGVADYRSSRLLQQLSQGGYFQFILNTVGENMEEVAFSLVNPQSRTTYVSIVNPFLEKADEGVMSGLSAGIRLFKTNLKFMRRGAAYRWAFAKSNTQALKAVKDLVEGELIRPILHGKVHAFRDLPEAYRLLEEGHLRGKVVVRFVDEDLDGQPAKAKTYDSLWEE